MYVSRKIVEDPVLVLVYKHYGLGFLTLEVLK
jgi:hypothetical protein